MNGIKNRFFWSWDHSTNWCLHTLGAQNCGVNNAYAKPPEAFYNDYKRVVDFSAEHNIGAVGIVGLLRDKHGGVAEARRLCDYANSRGVKIYIIAGLYAYGGIYYEGEHKYSLNRFFKEHPETVGVNAGGEPLIVEYKGKYGYRFEPQGCPSNPMLNEYVLESLDWLFKEIPELGGIQMGAGGNGVCQCERCRARRVGEESQISVRDMAGIYPAATDVVLSRSPEALVILETYHHFLDGACSFFDSGIDSPDLKRLLEMPKSVFWQWKCDARLRDGDWTENDRMISSLRGFNHVMRAHSGTQWWGGRATFAVDKIRRQCRLSHASGLNGVSIFGENSIFHTNAEFNYLAMEYFSDHPYADNAAFISDVMAPRLGGESFAEYYYEIASLNESPERIPEAVRAIPKITVDITDYEALRRWQYIASYLNGYYFESRESGNAPEFKNSDRIGEL